MRLYYHGVRNKTGPPSTPRHTACKVVIWAARSNCSQQAKNRTTQWKEKDAHLDQILGASKQAADFVLRYRVGRCFFAFPHSVGNRGPPNLRFRPTNLEKNGGNPMRKQNDGKSADDILQNQFTAYLVTAIKRRKALYIRKKIQQQAESPLELCDFDMSLQGDTDLLTGFSLLEQIENPMLHLALIQARERERYIFLTRILEERSFSELAEELGISYKATTHSYYRFIERIRKMMGGEEK